MQKYMTHPKHGGMLVYMDDFEQKQKEGWVFGEQIEEKHDKLLNVEENQPTFHVEHQAVKPKELSLKQQYEQKFGKKPHHLMKQENIKKALE